MSPTSKQILLILALAFSANVFSVDTDDDGFDDNVDNCPAIVNLSQIDTDGDLIGNACDDDVDGDGVENGLDLFPLDISEWADNDGDGKGDNRDLNDDNDAVLDDDDLWPFDNRRSLDTDGDGVADSWESFSPYLKSFYSDGTTMRFLFFYSDFPSLLASNPSILNNFYLVTPGVNNVYEGVSFIESYSLNSAGTRAGWRVSRNGSSFESMWDKRVYLYQDIKDQDGDGILNVNEGK